MTSTTVETTRPARTFFSVREAAERLGVHYNTVYEACRSGRIRAVRPLGESQRRTSWRIPADEIERLSSGSTVHEVASLLGYSVQTIYRQIRHGRIRATRPFGNQVLRVPADEIQRLTSVAA